MKLPRSRSLPLLALLATLGVAVPVHAQRQPLPDFALIAADGSEVLSGEALASGQHLLVYVRPDCRPCEVLLKLIDPDEHPLVPAAMWVVVGAGGEEAAAFRAGFPRLQDASWHVDPSSAVWQRLRLTGMPTVFGVRDGVIEWTLRGVGVGGDELKSILATWVSRPARPDGDH